MPLTWKPGAWLPSYEQAAYDPADALHPGDERRVAWNIATAPFNAAGTVVAGVLAAGTGGDPVGWLGSALSGLTRVAPATAAEVAARNVQRVGSAAAAGTFLRTAGPTALVAGAIGAPLLYAGVTGGGAGQGEYLGGLTGGTLGGVATTLIHPSPAADPHAASLTPEQMMAYYAHLLAPAAIPAAVVGGAYLATRRRRTRRRRAARRR